MGLGGGGGLGAAVASAAATTASAPAVTTTSVAPPGTQAASTTSGSASSATPPMSFRQMQELVNKWTGMLDDQEKEFIEAATKVNYWDKILMNNMDKISKMSLSMTKVKAEHEKMESVLDLVKNYQKDFETFLENEEANCPKIGSVETDNERAEFYGSLDRIHTELHQLQGDLKQVIRDINVSNKIQDKNDPVSQILRILNEHTDTLQWLDDQSAEIKESLDEVGKFHEFFRRDQERSLRLMFKPNE